MSDGIFQYILTETQSTRIVKAGGYDSHLPLLFIYHRRSQFTDFFSYSLATFGIKAAIYTGRFNQIHIFLEFHSLNAVKNHLLILLMKVCLVQFRFIVSEIRILCFFD